jgi:hypothetical protein
MEFTACRTRNCGEKVAGIFVFIGDFEVSLGGIAFGEAPDRLILPLEPVLAGLTLIS